MKYYIAILAEQPNNTSSFIDLWVPIISIIIAVIAIIISTYYANKSYRKSIKDEFQLKRETLFDYFNNFLLYLETVTNAKQYGVVIKTTNTKMDKFCLEAIGKINCFSYRNNLMDENKKKIEEFIKEMQTISNDIQDARRTAKNEENQKQLMLELSNRIRKLRSNILTSIKNIKFFKEQKNSKEA